VHDPRTYVRGDARGAATPLGKMDGQLVRGEACRVKERHPTKLVCGLAPSEDGERGFVAGFGLEGGGSVGGSAEAELERVFFDDGDAFDERGVDRLFDDVDRFGLRRRIELESLWQRGCEAVGQLEVAVA